MKSLKIIVPIMGVAVVGAPFEGRIINGNFFITAGLSAYECFTPESVGELLRGFFTIIRPNAQPTSGFNYSADQIEDDFIGYRTQTLFSPESYHRYKLGLRPDPLIDIQRYDPLHPQSKTTNIATASTPWSVQLRFSMEAAEQIPARLEHLVRVDTQSDEYRFRTNFMQKKDADMLAEWAKEMGVFIQMSHSDQWTIEEGQYA